MVKSAVAELILTAVPEVPSVRAKVSALMATAPPGFKIAILFQVAFPPSTVVLAAVTVLSHCAVLPATGATPPTQLEPKVRLSLLLALMTWAWALAPSTVSRRRPAKVSFRGAEYRRRGAKHSGGR